MRAVYSVGLTGGIGSGKSSVSGLLRSYGAVVLDADLMAREVVEVGTPGLAAVVEAFGPEVLRADGTLDRESLGKRVFGDPEQLARLNAIVHPLVGERYAALVAAAEESGAAVAVHDVPLLVENDLAGSYDAVVVVSATPATQLERLVRIRGMSEHDARARIDAQSTLAQKLAVATHVIDNDGPIEDLEPQVARLWAELVALASRSSGT
ncbi:MAG: dephospho-CoA kinase [Frankiales bacterium]|nr:dephospho-CoA kinase [Frankiales bacterium]